MRVERSEGSLASLRRLNRQRVIDALRRHGTISRAEIARRTGLSRSTVSSLVADLQADGLLTERAEPGAAHGEQGGRPPILLSFEASAGVALGIVEELLAEAGVDRSRVIGAGLGLPGPVDQIDGVVGSSAILPGWVGVAAEEELRRRLDVPVSVDNDANLGALGELVYGAGRGATDMVYIKITSGIGAGLILDGRLYRGWGGMAGELGHVLVTSEGEVCRCGNRGCLETAASTTALLELLRRSHGDISVAEMVALALDGDLRCRRVIADAGRVVGIAAAGLLNVLNPQRLILGGDLAPTGDLLLDEVREALRRTALPSATDQATVVAGELGDRAEVLGALAGIVGATTQHPGFHQPTPPGGGYV